MKKKSSVNTSNNSYSNNKSNQNNNKQSNSQSYQSNNKNNSQTNQNNTQRNKNAYNNQNNTQSNQNTHNNQNNNESHKSKYDKVSKNQIIKFNGKTTFFEVMNSAFSIGRVLINFIEYQLNSETGKGKQTSLISIYIPFDKFLEMKCDVLSGRYEAIRAKCDKEGTTFTNPIVNEMGGTSAKALKMQGKSRADGKSLSRQFKILGGKKFMLQAETGPGHENETGLIVPDYGSKGKPAEQRVSVPLSGGDMKRLFLITECHINAYLSAQYAKGEFDYKPYEK